ncbi:MAG: hypothetical protein ACI8RZ_007421 [Myxococcota bacterium]|jgi:hypothetical protein
MLMTESLLSLPGELLDISSDLLRPIPYASTPIGQETPVPPSPQ